MKRNLIGGGISYGDPYGSIGAALPPVSGKIQITYFDSFPKNNQFLEFRRGIYLNNLVHSFGRVIHPWKISPLFNRGVILRILLQPFSAAML